MVHKAQNLVQIFQMGFQALGLTMDENSLVKCAQARVVLG